MKFENKIPISITIGGKDVNKIRINGEVVWEKPVDADYFYVENTYNGSNTVSVKQTITGEPDSSTYAKTLQYSKDKTNWSTVTLSSKTYNISLNQGEKVYFRGNEGVFNHYVIRGAEQAYTKITANQTFNVGGNINTLVNYYNPNNLTLPQGVFNNLFRGNVNLVSAENLTLQPSSDGSLPVFAYLYLFSNCTSLIKPPVLIAKTLSNGSYYSLFDGCSKLDNLTVYTDDNSKTNCTYKWLNGVASTGTFNNMGGATYTKDSVSGIPTGWTEVKPDYFYVENTYNGSNTVTIQQTLLGSPDSSTYAKNLQYSKDKTNWSTITLSSTTYNINLNQGERVYFRGNEGVFNYWYSGGKKKAITTISANQTHTVGGNINTLLDYQDPYGLTLPQGAFCGIFENNTNLTSASDITLPPSVDGSLSTYCYMYLFKNCTNLSTVPNSIPAKIQGQDACNGMFAYTAITTSPALPASTLANNCYFDTFRGCTSLINPPALPAKTLKKNCYRHLFYDCSKLNHLTVYADDISATDCTKNWLLGVASEGTFNNYGSATYPTNSTNGIPRGWTEVKPNEPDYFYVENTYNGNNNIYVKTRASYKNTEPTGEFATTLEYSKDKTNWTTINLDYDYHKNGSTVISNLVTNLTLSLSVGEKVYFRNTSGYFGYVGNEGTHSHMFSSDENIKVRGNIKSLLDYRDMVGTTMKKGCFYEMFSEANKLTDASELILPDTVAESCYLGLFSGCSSLTSIPSLPALTMAPLCYCEMLKNTAITTPPALPSTNLAEYCYKNMLEGTPITTAPALPATTLSVGCYQGLFNSCHKLTTAPVLSATTLVDYCYRYLFMGCTKLNSITTYANNIGAEECTRWWLDSVASSGTFHNLGTATYVTDSVDGIPSGWQIVTE